MMRIKVLKADPNFWYARYVGQELEIKDVVTFKNSFDPSLVRVEYRVADRYTRDENGELFGIGYVREQDAELIAVSRTKEAR